MAVDQICIWGHGIFSLGFFTASGAAPDRKPDHRRQAVATSMQASKLSWHSGYQLLSVGRGFGCIRCGPGVPVRVCIWFFGYRGMALWKNTADPGLSLREALSSRRGSGIQGL